MPKHGLTIGMAIEKQSSNFEVTIPSSHGGTKYLSQTDGVFVYLAS